jgi:hypothetical protein
VLDRGAFEQASHGRSRVVTGSQRLGGCGSGRFFFVCAFASLGRCLGLRLFLRGVELGCLLERHQPDPLATMLDLTLLQDRVVEVAHIDSIGVDEETSFHFDLGIDFYEEVDREVVVAEGFPDPVHALGHDTAHTNAHFAFQDIAGLGSLSEPIDVYIRIRVQDPFDASLEVEVHDLFASACAFTNLCSAGNRQLEHARILEPVKGLQGRYASASFVDRRLVQPSELVIDVVAHDYHTRRAGKGECRSGGGGSFGKRLSSRHAVLLVWKESCEVPKRPLKDEKLNLHCAQEQRRIAQKGDFVNN